MPDHDPTKKPNTPSAESARRDLDDFWSIDRLIPPQKPRPTSRLGGDGRPRPTPAAVEIDLPSPSRPPHGSDGTDQINLNGSTLTVQSRVEASPLTAANSSSSPAPGTYFVPPHWAGEGKEQEPILTYSPVGVLLHQVRILREPTTYRYFERFSVDARSYHDRRAPATATPADFFSPFPQYEQMNSRQERWYLWWREQVRQGTYPDTAYAYIQLYLFELINLPVEDEAQAAARRDTLASVWMYYRTAHPQLDHYMCEWLCDYCLIHRLVAPLDILAPALDDIMESSSLKEFYLSSVVGAADAEGADEASSGLATARILLRHCCQYDYRKSKFATGEHRPLFDRTIPAALAAVLPLLLGGEGQKPVVTMLESTVTRKAYVGGLCTYQNRCSIEVTYTSFSRSHELRFLMGDMVKHIENRLRGWLGIRSRLSVMTLPLVLRDALDVYLNAHAPRRAELPKKKEPPRPAYEALYERPRTPVSVEAAAAIEAGSWATTRLLTEAFEEGGDGLVAPPPPPLPAAVSPEGGTTVPEGAPPATPAPLPQPQTAPALSDTAPVSGTAESPLAPYALFIRAALAGDREAQRQFAKSHHQMPDAIAEDINRLTTESSIMDIVLEDDGTGFYALLDDYRQEVMAMLD